MKSLKQLLRTVIVIGALLLCASAQAKVYVSVYTDEWEVETGLLKTTGVWGALTGHFSKAHQDQAVRQFEEHFTRLFPKVPNSIQLPTEVDLISQAASSPLRQSRTGRFGTEKVDTYQSFSVKFRFSIPTLSSDPNQGRLTPVHEITKASLLVTSDRFDLGEVDLHTPEQLLSEVKLESDSLGQTKVGLTPSLRRKLGQSVRANFSNLREDEALTMTLKVLTADQKTMYMDLKSWSPAYRSQFAGLAFLTKLSAFNPKFYQAACSSLLKIEN